MAIDNTAPDLAVELQKIYDSEINVRIGWLWDGGIEIRLGDDMNGYLAEETVGTVAEIVPWLQEAIAHFYPKSSYALSLGSELRERAKQRLFQPPKIGAQVKAPALRIRSQKLLNHGARGQPARAITKACPWKRDGGREDHVPNVDGA
jgi:hypothetical protein